MIHYGVVGKRRAGVLRLQAGARGIWGGGRLLRWQ